MVAAGKSLLRCPRSLVIVKASLANESQEEQEIEGQWSPVGEQVSLQDFGSDQRDDTNLMPLKMWWWLMVKWWRLYHQNVYRISL